MRQLLAPVIGSDRVSFDVNPAWSPDGERIVFASDRGNRLGELDLFIVDRDGSNLLRATNTEFTEEHPDWSPDGTRIAFSSYKSRAWRIYTISAYGGGYSLLSDLEASAGAHPKWSPDGSQVAFSCETITGSTFGKICIAEADGGASRVIDGDYYAGVSGLSWSPDGERIVFTNYIAGDLELFVIEVESGHLQRITHNASTASEPVWTSEPDSVVFLVAKRAATDVYAIGSQGGEVSKLFSLPPGFSGMDFTMRTSQ